MVVIAGMPGRPNFWAIPAMLGMLGMPGMAAGEPNEGIPNMPNVGIGIAVPMAARARRGTIEDLILTDVPVKVETRSCL